MNPHFVIHIQNLDLDSGLCRDYKCDLASMLYAPAGKSDFLILSTWKVYMWQALKEFTIVFEKVDIKKKAKGCQTDLCTGYQLMHIWGGKLQILGWKSIDWQNYLYNFVHSYGSITEASPQCTCILLSLGGFVRAVREPSEFNFR